jgi:hypothetical protein
MVWKNSMIQTTRAGGNQILRFKNQMLAIKNDLNPITRTQL